ncbi:MAG: SHOCT domain-containing protein [Candidatus Dormibacteria bacterium]
MGFLHKDPTPEADLTQVGIRSRAVVEMSMDDMGAMAFRGSFGMGMMTQKGREKTLAGDQTFSKRKVTLRIETPGKQPYTVETKIDYPLLKRNWLERGSSFEVLVDPNDPQHFAVDWNGPFQMGTKADAAAARPEVAAAMRGMGLDVNQITQMQLAARQMQAQAGQPGATMFVGGQMVGPQPITPGAAPAQNAEASKVDQLTKLADLHKSGALSDAEFEAEKTKLLNS